MEMVFYMKIVVLDEIYNFIVLNFSFKVAKMIKKVINFQQHIKGWALLH